MFSDIQNLYSFFPPINYPYLYTRKTTSYSRLIMAGIYLHIPFCKRRCIYCDFFSTTENDKKNTYVQALSKELELRKNYLDGEIIDTIYFGGGTPSQLEEKDFIQLFETIYKIYTVNPEAEITIEANPDDLTPEYIAMLRTLPFNRLSMGIQTFKEDTLRLLHRRHTAAQACSGSTSIPTLPRSWFSEYQYRLDVRTAWRNIRSLAKRPSNSPSNAPGAYLSLSPDL